MPVLKSQAYQVATGPVASVAAGLKLSPDAGAVTKFPDAEIAAFVKIFTTSPLQKRPHMRCDPILMKVAQQRAADLAGRRYFSHVDPDGKGPNYHVIRAGYPLPATYSRDEAANGVESLSAGASGGVRTWQSWMDGPKHKLHLIGEGDFYNEQSDFGIGRVIVPGSPYTFYWCFLSARRA